MSYMSSWIYSSLVENGWKLKKLLQVEYCMGEVWFVHICTSRSQWFFNFGWDSWKSFISYMCSWIYSSLVENGWKLKELQMFENGPKYKEKVKKLENDQVSKFCRPYELDVWLMFQDDAYRKLFKKVSTIQIKFSFYTNVDR